LNKIASEEARVVATEKARIAAEESARLAAEGARQTEQAKAAALAQAAEEARVAAEKAKQVEHAKVAAAEQARVASEQPAAEKIAAMKVDAGTVAGIDRTAEKAAGDKAPMEARPQQLMLPQVASLPAETAAVSSLVAGLLIKEIKIELKRIGCYFGRIDESWPKGSSNEVVRKFARYARLSSAPEEPSAQLLELLKSKPDGFCPLECGGREVERNGRCIKREAPRRAIAPKSLSGAERVPKPMSGTERADAAYRNGTYKVCMGATAGCYARSIKWGEEHATRWCSRKPTC
jgi:hypothetical protein